MSLLIVSVAMLWAAPLLYHWAGRYMRAHRVAERLLLIALGAFVVIDLIPQSFQVAGFWTLVLVAVGMLVPSAVERMWHGLAQKIHWVPLVFGTLGLALHAFLDGAAFIDPFGDRHMEVSLQIAVIVHRFFEGLFIWWALRPRFGWEVAAAVLGFSTSFTVAGYLAGGIYFHSIGTDFQFALFQALVSGSLLHLAFDRHGHAHEHDHDAEPGHDQAHDHGAHGHDHGAGGHDHDHGLFTKR